MSREFLDTNVLIYCQDLDDPRKKKAAAELVARLARSRAAVISTQVLQEYFSICTRKLGVEPLAVKSQLRHWRNMEVVTITPELIEDAVDIHILDQISFWDALIVAAAASANCATVWTEDLNPGQVVRGVRVQNPFAAQKH